MELYEKSDLDLIDKNIDDIVIRIEDIKKDMFGEPHKKPENTAQKPIQPEPNIEDVNKIVTIVLNFIKQKKRKIYGGYALNKIISNKNPKDAFYEKDDVPDIDVYSPDPIKDLVELCDMLSKEYPDVIGKEAIHEETYKIFTKGYNAIDLSYVPSNVFNNIPFIELDGIRYVHPNFAMIDLYKMITEPLFSSFRWKKIIPRLYTLQKHFPFNKVSKPVPTVYTHKNDINDMLSVIFDFIKDNKDVYLIGEFSYNQFLKESKIKKQNFSEINVPFHKSVSEDYVPTINKIVE